MYRTVGGWNFLMEHGMIKSEKRPLRSTEVLYL